jgi:hypothetical protein
VVRLSVKAVTASTAGWGTTSKLSKNLVAQENHLHSAELLLVMVVAVLLEVVTLVLFAYVGNAGAKKMDPQQCKATVCPNKLVYTNGNGTEQSIHIPTGAFDTVVQHFVNEDWDALAEFPVWGKFIHVTLVTNFYQVSQLARSTLRMISFAKSSDKIVSSSQKLSDQWFMILDK